MKDLDKGNKFNSVCEDFTNATKNELWNKSTDLWKFIKKDGIVKKYIDGELGNNLLFTYKSMAITNAIDDLADLAKSATLKLLSENNLDTVTNKEFVQDCIKYHRHSIKNIFYKFDEITTDNFNFDIKMYLEDFESDDLEKF